MLQLVTFLDIFGLILLRFCYSTTCSVIIKNSRKISTITMVKNQPRFDQCQNLDYGLF